MPFGFGEEQDELEPWIRYASSQNVSIFAAASNDGKNRLDDIAWPARDKDVICVHAGNELGSPSSFTPEPQDNMRVMVLGEHIVSAWPPHLGCEDDHAIMSGTSCAAPIAAGIAAVILGYAQSFLTTSEWVRLCHTQSLRNIFRQMQKTTQGYWWIRHWNLFDERCDEQWIKGEIRRAIF
ncbi:peptidase S8/S53 domain-containing protein [Paraphoma chrysanthemicola]|uniref:Peptidase S8/S53 domain-containing protein n=1 Tax=Paraphoma chrysanthemicola TaxID=798071 RepID=A0A8K0RF89_9PLEO|nr:peptidase S8/S53 domain-containing protein [Paraphoma chrysanthemicola]